MADLMFEDNKNQVMTELSNAASNLAFEAQNNFQYPSTIIKCIYEYCIEWRWTTPMEIVLLENNDQTMKVLYSQFTQRVGTAHIDGISIDRNQSYLFKFRYIAGINMDAIIGLFDQRWKYKKGNIQSIGNESDSFNWGLRYDGVPCFQNEMDKWTDKICDRWKNGDIIHFKVDTTRCDSDDVSAVDIWINKEKLEVKVLLKDYPEIQYPLYLGASAARNGGIELIKGIKLL